VGNRLVSVAGIAGNPNIYYAGAASGGIWKTVDAGLNWKPIFDKQPVHAIGALSISPVDPNIVWAGTGEPFIRSNVSIGDGIWKSEDAGESWTNVGLQQTGRISRIISHPTNPDIIYVASLGHAYLPQKERGIYRSTDGGREWELVLHVNDSTGASDLVMDPNNPRILFAGMWQLDLKTWTRESGGAGSGIYMSRDAGDTWKRLEGNGLPELPVGKIALAMTPKNSARIYALIETGDGVPWHGRETESGELWRSDDGGKKWMVVNYNRDLSGRQAYYTRCAASPDDADEVYFLAASYSISIDGGKTAKAMSRAQAPNWDHHEMWIDPTDGDRMIVVGDGGVSISTNRGVSWMRVQLPVAQMYHVTTDNHVPYNVYGNRQDGPSMRGPSRSRVSSFMGSGTIYRGMWHSIGGGESGFATPDPVYPDIIWSSASGRGAVGGIVVRYNEKNRQFRQLEVWPESTIGHPAKDVRYRFQWTFPLLISPHDHNTIYVTSQHVHRTTNGGESWDLVSPDLTTNDSTKMNISGGLTPDNIGVEYACVIYAFDESPVKKGVLWAGTNDGLVQVSRDNGQSWINVTGNIPDLPPLGTVRNIDASKWDAATAYITVDFHEVGNFDPFVYKTDDYGENWQKITAGIPKSTLSYCRHVLEDPVRKGLLYLGTENALYISFDDGEKWMPFKSNLPPSPVYWMQVQEHFNDLVVGTYGRGIWILDDLTPLQQMDASLLTSEADLLKPKNTYRFIPITAPMFMFDDPSAGQDPPPGAAINYWLHEDATDSIEVHIIDMGDTLRTIKHLGKKGLNRVWWDLYSDKTDALKLRTSPQYAEWVELDKDRTRKSESTRFNMLVAPGTYTVTFQYAGKNHREEVTILKDPHSEGSEDDIKEQAALMKSLYNDMNDAVAIVNEMELIRRQMLDLKMLLKERNSTDPMLATIDSVDYKLLTLEQNLLQLNTTFTGQDMVRWPERLVGKISYLASTVQTADFRPNSQQRAVNDLLREQLANAKRSFREFLDKDLERLGDMLKTQGVGGIIKP
ncbi:MAG: sialidase, partial [Saprospiraceae bacterium]|nr:sialidase [Saprospiraceae bacterium]